MNDDIALKTLSIGKSWFDADSGGGSDRVMEELHRVFPAVGVSPRGFVIGENKKLLGIEGLSSEADSLLARGRAMRRAVSSTETDVFAVHFALYAWFCRHHLRGKPVVIHFHGPWALESGMEGAGKLATTVKKAVESSVYSRGVLFITLSHAFAGVLEQEYHVDRGRIRIVPGGADIDRFGSAPEQHEARDQLGWDKNEFVVVAVRRLAKRMGLENLIKAVKPIMDIEPRLKVRIAGTGPEKETLQRLITDAHLNGKVILEGFVPDDVLPTFYSAADLSIVPSTGLEGFGLIVVESMASGTPCLVSPVGGMPEIVSDLDKSLILSDATVDSIAQHLQGLVTRSSDLPAADACRAYARSNYSWPVVARRTREVYLEALHGRT